VANYFPLLITFLIGLVGLVLKTTKDSAGPALRKPLTHAGWGMLLLLSAAFLVSLIITYSRSKSTNEQDQREAERYTRDSTTMTSQLTLVRAQRDTQRIALDESRKAANAQSGLLTSSLVASRDLARSLGILFDSLRAQRTELDRTAQAQRELLLTEGDRLRNQINTPRVTINIELPPISEAKRIALQRIQGIRSDSLRDRRQRAVLDSEYSSSNNGLITSSGEVPLLFPTSIFFVLAPARNHTCGDYVHALYIPYILLALHSGSSLDWSDVNRWSNRLTYRISTANPQVMNQGLSSLSELREGCVVAQLATYPQGDELSNDRFELFEAIWEGATVFNFDLDFGGGRQIQFTGGYTSEGSSPFPVQFRLSGLPWESVPPPPAAHLGPPK
jgi:hypothetical protein